MDSAQQNIANLSKDGKNHPEQESATFYQYMHYKSSFPTKFCVIIQFYCKKVVE
jgi:hypothetical protein